MNVVRTENSTRGRGRGRGRDAGFVTSNQIINVAPKYEFKTERRALVNVGPSTSATGRTPGISRRGQTIRSSSIPSSTVSRRRYESSAQTSPGITSGGSDQCIILAITSGRGDARGEVGMAAIDVQHPHMILCQISDSHAYGNTLSKINALQPVEIIMPDTMCERSIHPNGLYREIKEKFEGINITGIARMHFHDSAGMDRIKTHCAKEFATVELLVKQKYYALAAASALLKYIEYIQHIVYAPKSMRIDFQGSQNTTMIDIGSAQSLELVTTQGGNGKCSLLGSLDRCSTPMGRRLLRASILQPPCDVDLVKNRQACVVELVANRSLHSILQPVVKRLFGASRLLSLAILTSQADNVQAAEKNLNYILLLKNIIDIIPEFQSVTATGQAPFFKKVHEDLKDPRYRLIKEKILSVVHTDARSVLGFTSSNMQRCFAVRSGISDMLDIARQTYCELIDDMQRLIDKLAERYKLPLSLGCNATLGYHIEMEAPRRKHFKIDDLPEELIEPHKRKGKILTTTEYLAVLSRQCTDANEELHLMSNALLNDALTSVREYIGCLLKLNDDVAELDLLLSLAQVSAIPDYVKPTFGTRLELRNSRHPVMDIWRTDRPTANDVVASGSYNFHTITGPNMSGKSVYLKQIVLLQIMGQIGCHVPATKAEFRITDRIFCRISSPEDTECNASTFVLEVKEAQYILQSITPTSIVILDELCRSTTVEEGASIAWAICEKLLRTSDAFVFNATHFLYLLRLSELYCNVTNHYFETEFNVTDALGNDSRLIYSHKLKPGIAPVRNYGIALARSTRLPGKILSLSEKLAKTEIAETVSPSERGLKTDPTKKLNYDCVVRMNGLLESDRFTVEDIVKLVDELKIPGTIGKTIILSENEDSRVYDRTSCPVSSVRSKDGIIEVRRPSKRVSATSVSSNPEIIKKGRVDTSEFPSSPVQSSVTSEHSPAESPGTPVENISHIGHAKRSPPIDFRRLSNRTIFIDATEVTAADPYAASGSSVATLIARRTAREKEANIFKVIEGNDFDEACFYKSFGSTVTIESSDED